MNIKKIIQEEVDWFEHESDFSGTIFNFDPPLPTKDYTKLVPMLKEMGVTHWINSAEPSLDNNYPAKYKEKLGILVVREDNQLVWSMASLEHWKSSNSNEDYFDYVLVDGYEFFDVVLDESLNESEGFKDSTEEDFEWTEDTNPSFSDELLYLLEGTPYSFTLSNNGGYLLRLYRNNQKWNGLEQQYFLRTIILKDDTMGSLKSALNTKIKHMYSDIEFEKSMEMPNLNELSEKVVMLEEILNLLTEY